MLTEPAVGRTFFGRDEILSVLEKRVTALKNGYRQNIALTGQMLAGKSSILYQFLYTLKDSSLIPIYIECAEETLSSFADKFIATLLYNYLSSYGVEVQKELNDLMEKAEPLIPRTVYGIKKVKSELSKRNYNASYGELLNLTSILKKETQKSCVVILDEFHNLESIKIKKPYLHFGKIIMIQKDTMYIVSSSQKSTIKKILSEKLALLYGNFEVIEVSGFDNKTASDFLKDKLQNIVLSQDYADYLIDFTDGNPFYLDAISKKIVEVMHPRHLSYVSEDVIIDSLTALFHNTNGTINQYFTNNIMSLLEKDLREEYLDLLIALACGSNKLSEIAKWFGKKNQAGFTKKLKRLVELDIIYKNGVFYDILDKVFKFWLKTVYHKKKNSLVDDIVNRKNDFKEDVKSDMDDYLVQSQKGVTERVKELLLLFGGETVEIENRQRKLPKFMKIELARYPDCEDLITQQKENKYWIYEIYKGKIDESAVSNFIERYYPMKDKISKKICIALEGIDANALLLAKEKNIWVWDLNNINGLMRLYKKHGLIYK